MRRVLLAVGLLLVFAPAAQAGGWATVGLSSTPERVNREDVGGRHDGAPARAHAADRRQAGRDDPQRRPRRCSPPSRPASRASTAPRWCSRRAGRWTYQVDDGFISAAAAHLSGRCRSAARRRRRRRPRRGRRRPEPAVADPRHRAAARRGRAADRAAARAPSNRRRRESHHPRRRWPRLRGGGDDDRRLRRRRPGRLPRPTPAHARRARRPRRAGLRRAGLRLVPHVRARQRPRRHRPRPRAEPARQVQATTCCSRSSRPTPRSRQGWNASVMPDDFAQRIAPRDLDPLVAYLMKGAPGRIRGVFDHVTIRVSDRAASERFYDTVLPVLGKPRYGDGSYTEWGDFSIVADDEPVAERLHIALLRRPPTSSSTRSTRRASTPASAATARPARATTRPTYYGAFLLDPDGNSVEAVSASRTTAQPGQIDHCGCARRTSTRSARFYETIAPDPRLRGPAAAHPSTPTSQGATRLVLVHRRRRADRARPHRVRRRHQRRRRRLPRRRHRAPATRTTAPPASGRSTTPATTAPSCSTPTATTSRPSTTTAEQRPPRLDLGVVDEVVHALEDVDRHDRAQRGQHRLRSPAPATPAPSRPGRTCRCRPASPRSVPSRGGIVPRGPQNPPV